MPRIFFFSLLALYVCSCLAAADRSPLTLIDEHLAHSLGAYCLDGSLPGYYLSKSPSNSRNWVIFLQGGGWCYTFEDCVARATTRLGSSLKFPKSAQLQHMAVLNRDASANPDFHDWNHVFVPYCDGASFSGAREAPVNVSGVAAVTTHDDGDANDRRYAARLKMFLEEGHSVFSGQQISLKQQEQQQQKSKTPDQLYFRGRAILEAVHATFANELEESERVLLSGCSAGGLATLLHTDRLRQWLPDHVHFKSVPGSGFFLWSNTFNGQPVYAKEMMNVFKMQNASSGVDQSCIEANRASSTEYKCMSAAETLRHLSTPTFIQNSIYDSWQMVNVWHPGPPRWSCGVAGPTNCTLDELQMLNKVWRLEFLEAVQPALEPTSPHGVFLYSCFTHCYAANSPTIWTQLRVGGKTLVSAVSDWYNRPDASGTKTKLVGCVQGDPSHTCEPSCG